VAELLEQRRRLAAMVGLVVEEMHHRDPVRERTRAPVDAALPAEVLGEPRLGEAAGPAHDLLAHRLARRALLGEVDV